MFQWHRSIKNISFFNSFTKNGFILKSTQYLKFKILLGFKYDSYIFQFTVKFEATQLSSKKWFE